jgi:predicted Zn finger-like uncharacterized protein
MATIVITCESCGTKFRLDSDKLKNSRSKVRCSKCHSVFMVEQPDEDDLIHIEISDEENTFIPESDSESDSDADFEGDDKFEALLPPRTESVKRGGAGKNLLIAGIVAVPVILLLVLIFELLGRSQMFQAKKPPVGALKPLVTISENLKAYYLENMNSGEVLVIEGKVLNKSTKSVSFIMIQGKLFNRKDAAVLTQSCYAGNPLTRAEISHLKFSEIQKKMMNREGRSLKDVRIPPAAEVPFVLVFHDLPEISTLSNYSVNVVSSQLD